MKILYIFLLSILFLGGCSSNYALREFDLDDKRELSEISFETRKLLHEDNSLAGVLSSIYLNEVYPKTFYGDEYFYVSFYAKDSSVYIAPRLDVNESYDLKIDKDSIDVKLNSRYPTKIIQLPKENDFSRLLDINNEWSKSYIVIFEQSSNLKLNLRFSYDDVNITIPYSKDY